MLLVRYRIVLILLLQWKFVYPNRALSHWHHNIPAHFLRNDASTNGKTPFVTAPKEILTSNHRLRQPSVIPCRLSVWPLLFQRCLHRVVCKIDLLLNK